MQPVAPNVNVDMLDSRAKFWLVVTVIGTVMGLVLISGPLGWIFGRNLRRRYKAFGHRPAAAATATWLLGIIATVTGIAAILFAASVIVGLMFHG
ncbi:MAG: hypothetical protein K0V04_10060 [Deltaproteobacteria bacterium]|nr:hypothetical protein [Deltaproteobacteria bacterium]